MLPCHSAAFAIVMLAVDIADAACHYFLRHARYAFDIISRDDV